VEQVFKQLLKKSSEIEVLNNLPLTVVNLQLTFLFFFAQKMSKIQKNKLVTPVLVHLNVSPVKATKCENFGPNQKR
jgi:hypothetical protein